MPDRPFTSADLELLRKWDTPTICNALEIVVPARRARGFSYRPFVVADPALPPICGLARTGRIRAAAPSGRSREEDRAARLGWYEYVADADLPTVVVIEDLDEEPGFGAFWGEVNSAIHKGLGVLGCVTNGSFRDIDMLAPGFQILGGVVNPSHAHVHVVDFRGEVTVHGMPCAHDEVVHADRHGAVVIPAEAVRALPAAIELCARRERVILDMAKRDDFGIARLREALAAAEEIH
ncbi:RraA family protein [Crenalkalicoccus roseus]|uniref:RraA family protein n=1 Tax=Crenalkalicoccus roseus TaxID=1485588 RepID=UPI00108030D6|nr:RraA family protein [Crenalkalicoccus roseus]